jgi:hypothetical protein
VSNDLNILKGNAPCIHVDNWRNVKKIMNLFQYKCGVLNTNISFNNYDKCQMQFMNNGFNMLKDDGSNHVPWW